MFCYIEGVDSDGSYSHFISADLEFSAFSLLSSSCNLVLCFCSASNFRRSKRYASDRCFIAFVCVYYFILIQNALIRSKYCGIENMPRIPSVIWLCTQVERCQEGYAKCGNKCKNSRHEIASKKSIYKQRKKCRKYLQEIWNAHKFLVLLPQSLIYTSISGNSLSVGMPL